MKLTLCLIFIIVISVMSESKENMNSTSTVRHTNGQHLERTVVTNNQEAKEINVISKCGDFGTVCVLANGTCVDRQKFDLPTSNNAGDSAVYVNVRMTATKDLEMLNASEKEKYRIKYVKCDPDNDTTVLLDEIYFKIGENGDLHVVIDEATVQSYSADKYCIDNFVWQDTTSNTSQYKFELNALICFPKVETETKSYQMSSSCMLISCFFIILTVAVYAWLPELRNLHGMVLMAYLSSFFVGFLFLATMQILIIEGKNEATTCITFTFIIYYSLLAAFFWMNVMCYDIWWTFSGRRSLSGRKSSVTARFLSYSAYAFGVPTILTILLAVLEFTVDPRTSRFLPRIKEQGCFLYGNSKFIYLYVPILVLCVANLIFFTLTAIRIAKIKEDTKMLNKQDDKQRFTLYIKLFIVMGVNWILEVVSSFYPEADYIWQFTDAYNVLVGLIICIIFVCKKKTLNMIKKRYKHMTNQPLSRTHTTSTSMSTSKFSQTKDETQINCTTIK